MYFSMSEKLKKKNPDSTTLERNLFHATDDEQIVQGICYQNFDPRMHGKNATMYGRGAYFAENASYSSGYASSGNARYMFYAKVLVGNYAKGDSSMMRPPNLPGSQFELYDSTVNDVSKPSIYVVYDKAQCYPQHLILYSPAQVGQVKKTMSGVQSQPASVGASSGTGTAGALDPVGASGQASTAQAAQALQSLGMSPTAASVTVAAAQALHAAASGTRAQSGAQSSRSPSHSAPQGPKNKNCIVM